MVRIVDDLPDLNRDELDEYITDEHEIKEGFSAPAEPPAPVQ